MDFRKRHAAGDVHISHRINGPANRTVKQGETVAKRMTSEMPVLGEKGKRV
jgi:hypothetical protein